MLRVLLFLTVLVATAGLRVPPPSMMGRAQNRKAAKNGVPTDIIEIDIDKPVFTTNDSLREGVQKLVRDIIDKLDFKDGSKNAEKEEKRSKGIKEFLKRFTRVSVGSISHELDETNADAVYANVDSAGKSALKRQYCKTKSSKAGFCK